MEKLLAIFKKIFSLDLKSLALFRIIIGLILSYDLINRVVNLKSHYTAKGVLPIGNLEGIFKGIYFSFHALSDAFYWQLFLFIVAFVFALAFTLGFKTKLTAVVSWVLLFSIQNKNPLITYGADVALLASLFWGMFLPLSSHFSIDAKNKIQNKSVCNVASIALVIQVFSIFVITGLYKMKFPAWSTNFNAVEFVLYDLSFVTPIGDLLLFLPSEFLKLLTILVLVIEVFFPLIFVFGYFHFRFKLVSIFGLLFLLIGFGLCLFVGIFPFVVGAMLIALLPPEFWNKKHIKSTSNHNLNPILQFFLGILVILTIAFNTMYVKQFVVFPKAIQKGMSFIGLTQYWIMFAPPTTYIKWPIVKATFKDGSVKNLLYPKEEYSEERPERFGAKIWNERWQAFYSNIGKPSHFKSLSEYHVRKWYSNPNDKVKRLEKLEIMYLYQNIQLDSINRYGKTYKYVFSSYNCEIKQFQSYENGKLN